MSQSTNSIAAAIADLQAFSAGAVQLVTEVYRGLAINAFHYVAMNTPQWSGNAASNWNIGLGTVDTTVTYELLSSNVAERASMTGRKRNYPRMKFGAPVAQKGDERGVQVATARAASKVPAVTLAVPVYISNAAEGLNRESYIQFLETNPDNFLRAVNEPGHMVTLAALKGNSFGVLNDFQITTLRNLALGNLQGGIFA